MNLIRLLGVKGPGTIQDFFKLNPIPYPTPYHCNTQTLKDKFMRSLYWPSIGKMVQYHSNIIISIKTLTVPPMKLISEHETDSLPESPHYNGKGWTRGTGLFSLN